MRNVDGLTIPTPGDARLTWGGGSGDPRIVSLYEQTKQLQWNASTDVDWSVEVEFGSALPEDSTFGLSAFRSSPLARRGRGAWDSFRWEFHAWLASQFAHGEQGAVIASARLTEVLPDVDAKCFAAVQVADEARHVEAFSRYVREKMPSTYPVAGPLSRLLTDIFRDARWDITALGLHVILEGLAMAMLRMANSTFHDELIRDITRLAARDEARHVAFGIVLLKTVCSELSGAELAEREDVVLEAAAHMRRWFLLDDLWERVDVDRAEGVAFATGNPMMVAYRQAVFAKVAGSLSRIGLMTGRVRDGLLDLGLVGPGIAAARSGDGAR
jgi:hypothetical protein